MNLERARTFVVSIAGTPLTGENPAPRAIGGAMLALDSEAGVRAYVNAELERTVRAKRPDLEVAFMDAGSKGLCWTISLGGTKGTIRRYYLLEARLANREFLIWFGYSDKVETSTPRLIRPAVLVPFGELEFAARGFPPQLSNPFALGAVLEYMFLHDEYYPANSVGWA